MSLRIALITDIHNSSADSGYKKCALALPLLRSFVAWANDAAPDIVVGLGDLIEEVSPGEDTARFNELKALFDEVEATVEHVPGNHDIRNLGIVGMEAIFGTGTFTSRSEDVNGFHLVYFCPIAETGPYTFTSNELEWLEDDLAGTSLPTLIFTHVPICAGDLRGNGYFSAGGNGEWTNSADAMAIIKASTTIAVFQGHTHWNAIHTEDDIHYITIPSLTEQRRTMPAASASFALVEIDAERIKVRVRGRDNATYALRRRQADNVWP